MITCPNCGQTQLASRSEIDRAVAHEVIEFPCHACGIEWRITMYVSENMRMDRSAPRVALMRRMQSQKLKMRRGKRVAPDWGMLAGKYRDHA